MAERLQCRQTARRGSRGRGHIHSSTRAVHDGVCAVMPSRVLLSVGSQVESGSAVALDLASPVLRRVTRESMGGRLGKLLPRFEPAHVVLHSHLNRIHTRRVAYGGWLLAFDFGVV